MFLTYPFTFYLYEFYRYKNLKKSQARETEE